MKTYFIKLAFSCTFLMLAFQALAQVPQKMSYQAVIRNTSNNLVANSPVGLRFSILQDSSTGPAVYVETHRPTTNINGLASVEIGAGTVVSGTFATINWSTGKYFLKTDTDPNGGTSYTISGTTQFLTVPYAFVADRVLNPAGNNGFNTAVKVTNIISGTYGCRAGGYKLQFGLDSNRNGILDNAEIITSLTRNVCNGAQGAQGPQGVGITSTVDNLNGTFTLFYSDGSSYTTSSLIGPAGASGVGISSTTDNGNGTFTLNYSDGTSFTTSNLTGPAGAQGATGPQGPTGQTGAQGAAGVGIVSTVNNGNGTYTFNYSDGSSFTTSNLTGPAGAQGATGPQGPIGQTGATGPQGPVGQTGATGAQGPAGTNGVSVTNSFVQGDSLYVVLSNGQTLNTGYVRGPQGATGAAANLPSGQNNETMRNINGVWQSDSFLVNNGQQLGIGNVSPHGSAILELSTSNKGFLPPRLSSSERNAITNPAIGLVIYNTTQNCLNYFAGNSWYELCGNCTPPTPNAPSAITGNITQCINATNQTYSVSNVPNATTYNWTVPPSWTILSGLGTNQITVHIGSNAQSGIISVSASNGCGTSSLSTVSVTVSSIPNATTSSTHTITSSQITWNWVAVNGATGYYVNSSNNLATAQLITTTSFTQSGLTCNTGYTLYVWANNNCGTSNPIQLNQSTSGCCQIGTTNFGGVIAILNNTNPCTGVAATVNSAPNTYTFSDAVNYCDNLVEGGFSDWYLPTYSQLLSMYSSKLAIGNFLNAIYWSPTPTGDGRYWTVNFQGGQSYGYDSSIMYMYRVRCVRNF